MHLKWPDFLALLITFLLLLVLANTVEGHNFASLKPCCKYQGQFSVSNKKCDSLLANNTFPEVLTIPKRFSVWAYGNLTGDLKFRLEDGDSSRNFSKPHFEIELLFAEISNLSKQINFTLEGYLKHGMDYFAPTEYCVNRLSESSISLIVFNATCTPPNPCIRKCCEFGEVWDLSGPRLQCRPSGIHQWTPTLYIDPHNELNTSERTSIQPHFIADHPRNGWCDPVYASLIALRPYKNKTDMFRVLKDGTVMRKLRALTWVKVNTSLSCLDGGQNWPDSDQEFYTGSVFDTVIFDCEPSEKDSGSSELSRAYGIAMIVSCVFLLITVSVYFLLWEKQNVHSWIIQCYTGSLLITYIFLALLHFADVLKFHQTLSYGHGLSPCQGIGICLHFFFISTFCWLTIINFDLWWTFRTLKPTAGRSKGFKKFGFYILFALGVPLAIVATALALDITYRDNLESDIIIPLYGLDRCYMEVHKPMLVYVYIPVAILLTTNMALFIATVVSMYKIHQATKFASSSSSKNKNASNFKLFAKLFIIMGVTWIFELLSYGLSKDSNANAWYWAIFDFTNIFQAILIFFIFVCKRETIAALRHKFPLFQRFTNLFVLKPKTRDALIVRYPKLKGILHAITCSSNTGNSSGNSAASAKSTNTNVSAESGSSTEKIEMK